MTILKLSELTQSIKETIAENFDKNYYIIAEILQINTNISGHCYIELIEKDESTNNVIAKIRAVIWANRYNWINEMFRNTTGEVLRSGIKILANVQVNFHPVFGLSLIITDIDPSYTIGEYEITRQKVIEQLTKDGVIDLNKSLPFPLVPQKFAIISSPSAAGLGDFREHIDDNPYGYKFEYKLFEAIMQGEGTEKSIIEALDKIYEEISNFEFVVIIRGGGSKHDLAAFDSYNLCSHIAQYPLPILTGIGHQRDNSVADMVSYKALKTPTAVADFIVQCCFDFEVNLIEKVEKLKTLINNEIDNQKAVLSQKFVLFSHITTNHLNIAQTYLENKKQRFVGSLHRYYDSQNYELLIKKQKFISLVNQIIKEQHNWLKQKFDKIMLQSPQNILQKGYTLTLKDNKIITKADELASGDRITTYFANGNINSIVE